MSNFHRHRSDCRLCASSNIVLAVPLAAVPIVTPNSGENADKANNLAPLGLYLCQACGNLQLSDIIDPGLQYNNFRYTTSISLGLPEHFREMARHVASENGLKPNAQILEIGSNDGTLLRAFKEMGFKVLGIDPAQVIAAKATEAGIPTIADFFTFNRAQQIAKDQGKVDLIIANNTFANIDDLTDIMAGIRCLLNPGGSLVIETQHGAAVIRNNLVDTIYHEHLSYFMVKSLRDFFTRQNMTLVRVEAVSTKGGSIRLTIKPGQHQAEPTVTQFIQAEENDKLFDLETYQAFSQNLTNISQEIQNIVKQTIAQGGKIAGFGASVGTLTLLNQFKLENIINVIFDDKPLCQNISGPNYNIPVTIPQNLDQYALIIVFAWRYAQNIIAKHPTQKGKFLTPLPKPIIL